MQLLVQWIILFFVSMGNLGASEISGYIGSQSFRLTDDYDLANLTRRAEDAKLELARAEVAERQLSDQLRSLENQYNSLSSRLGSLNREIESLKQSRSSLLSRLDDLKRNPETNAEAINSTQREISSLESQIDSRSREAGQLKMEVASLDGRVNEIRRDYSYASRRADDARSNMSRAARDRDSYRQELIAQVSRANSDGARVAQSDGARDGADLSARLGNERGHTDGTNDGHSDGTRAGEQRYYRSGFELGDREGSSRARLDGQRDGTVEGTKSGNSSAGNREGTLAGIKRAEASNAKVVGIEQGKKAGFERAVATGKIEGRKIGESETTKKMESETLKEVSVSGAFAGSFARSAPSFPGNFTGSNYRPSAYQSKDILRKAYTDGYIYTYHQYTRYEFQRRIDSDYNQRYDSSYRTAYDISVSREYPAYYDQGRRDGDARAYNRDYPVFKAEAFRVAFNQFDSNPNRTSAEFRGSYATAELAAYSAKYEEIRSINFEKTELDVFKANIAEQTEIFRQQRIAEVSAIYQNNAVLQFVGSEIFDGGIRGVGVLDGVFQPQETTTHHVILKNFGFKEAKNVVVSLEGGKSTTLSSIPARSVVKIKGASQGVVLAPLQTTYKSKLSVAAILNTQDVVEARHFDRASAGILKESDQKIVSVAYPLGLSSLALESQLLKGQKNKLSITLSNHSKREYKGDIKIKLEVNSQGQIITKEFSSVPSLVTTLTLSDAEVLVTLEEDAYRDLDFSARVEQDGVVVGVLPKSLVVMAKAGFSDKGKVPVLVANSELQGNLFLDALADLGGSDKVSVLDLSLASLNANVLANGLSQKILVVIDDSRGSSLKTLNTFIGKSKSSSFILVDESGTGLKNTSVLGSFKDSVKLLFGKRSIYFTNQHRAAGVIKSSSFIQSTPRNFVDDLELAKILTFSPAEHLAEIKNAINVQNFSTPNDIIKLYSLKALSEILAINVAYDESGGIFSRDKKWAKMIEEDRALFHNALKNASSGEASAAKMPYILSAIAMKETITGAIARADGIYREMKLKITNTTNSVLSDMEKSFDKSLKKNFKDTYNRAYAFKNTHHPFFIPEPRPDYGN